MSDPIFSQLRDLDDVAGSFGDGDAPVLAGAVFAPMHVLTELEVIDLVETYAPEPDLSAYARLDGASFAGDVSINGESGENSRLSVVVTEANECAFSVANNYLGVDPWVHINANGFGLVGNGTHAPPFLSLESDPNLSRELRFSITNDSANPGGYAEAWAKSTDHATHPQRLFVRADSDIYFQAGTSNFLADNNSGLYLGASAGVHLGSWPTGQGWLSVTGDGAELQAGNYSVPLGQDVRFDGPADPNWRIGIINAISDLLVATPSNSLQVLVGIAETESTGDGFAVGNAAGEAIMELRGADKYAAFRGSVDVASGNVAAGSLKLTSDNESALITGGYDNDQGHTYVDMGMNIVREIARLELRDDSGSNPTYVRSAILNGGVVEWVFPASQPSEDAQALYGNMDGSTYWGAAGGASPTLDGVLTEGNNAYHDIVMNSFSVTGVYALTGDGAGFLGGFSSISAGDHFNCQLADGVSGSFTADGGSTTVTVTGGIITAISVV